MTTPEGFAGTNNEMTDDISAYKLGQSNNESAIQQSIQDDVDVSIPKSDNLKKDSVQVDDEEYSEDNDKFDDDEEIKDE